MIEQYYSTQKVIEMERKIEAKKEAAIAHSGPDPWTFMLSGEMLLICITKLRAVVVSLIILILILILIIYKSKKPIF